MAKNKIYLDGADLTENEKQFIHEITPQFQVKLLSVIFSQFRSFMESFSTRDLTDDPSRFPLMKSILVAQKKAGLKELSPKLMRAVELLATGQSPRPLTNNPTDWKWSEYYKHYHHRGCHRMIRYELEGPIYKTDAVHNFPKPKYAYWQGYASTRMVRRNEFPINPLIDDHKVFYYAEPWDGKGVVEDRIAKSTLLQFPEYASSWLALQRSNFQEEVEEQRAFVKQLLDPK